MPRGNFFFEVSRPVMTPNGVIWTVDEKESARESSFARKFLD